LIRFGREPAMLGAAKVGDPLQLGVARFLREIAQHTLGVLLVHFQEPRDGPRYVARRHRPLSADLGADFLDDGADEPFPAAETANHTLHADAGAARDFVQRELVEPALARELDERVDDLAARLRRRLGARGLFISAATPGTGRSFHVSE